MRQPKGQLIERTQALGLGKPVFDTEQTGPEHEPTFVSEVRIDGALLGSGSAGNKREAEGQASLEALEKLEDMQKRGSTPDSGNSPVSQGFVPEFEGPWPIFAEVLASCLNIANSRVDSELTGSEAMMQVQRLAVELYQRSLERLGEVIEVED